MDMKIGVTAWQLACKAEDSLAFAKKAGLSYLQLDLGAAQEGWPLSKPEVQEIIRKRREETGVEILSVVLNDLCQNGFVNPDGSEKRKIAEETMRRGVEAAAALGVSSICVPSFFDNAIREGADLARTEEALRTLCDLAAKDSIHVYTENVLPAEALAGLFARVGRGNLRLLFDSQNYPFMAKRESAPIFESVKGLVGGFLHVKDGVAALGDRPLGKGASQFSETLDAIVKSGFSGVYLLENRYETVESLREEANVLRDMIRALS